MAEIILNLLRRKMRTALTISGIFIGILALTVLGALAERVTMMTRSAELFFAGHILVTAQKTGEGPGIISSNQIAQIKRVPGVERVGRIVELPYAGARGTLFGQRPLVYGIEVDEANKRSSVWLPLQAGRQLVAGDRQVLVAGADLAAENAWRVGDAVDIHGKQFKLVGILQRMISSSDQWVFVPIEDARALLIQSNPLLRMLSQSGAGDPTDSDDLLPLELNSIATSLRVVWTDDVDPDQLSQVLQHRVPELTFVSPRTLSEMLARDAIAINLIVLGSALIALIVGGLSVVNTMTMAVTERRAEIAIKRALGATTAHIVREYLAESALLGLFGGLVGVGGGILMVRWLNSLGALSNTEMFLVTPRLIAFALGFAVLLGALSGLGPALHGARLHPIDGLREE